MNAKEEATRRLQSLFLKAGVPADARKVLIPGLVDALVDATIEELNRSAREGTKDEPDLPSIQTPSSRRRI